MKQAMSVLDLIWERAKGVNAKVVLPETEDERVLKAAQMAVVNSLARPVLLGNRGRVGSLASKIGIKLDGIEVIDPASDPRLKKCSQLLYQRRKEKGLSRDDATGMAMQPLYFAALLLALGEVDCFVAGASTATADVLRALIFCVGTDKGVSCISSCFLMVLNYRSSDEKVFIFADPSVIPDPDPGQLASIAIASARTFSRLTGREPMVAMLSFSTKGSAKHPMIDKVLNAMEIAKSIDPSLKIDGELQADAAIVPDVAKRKAPDSEVAGHANVLVFPDLNAANIAYKLVERLAGAKAVGPLLQGVAKPASDLSRGCSSEDIVNTIAMTAAQRAVP
ncbi:MAG: phosphate acetyltransferase [bacterium]